MIFSNKIYKIASGKNVSLYANNDNSMIMYYYNEKISKRNIIFAEIVRCVMSSTSLEGKFAKKINDGHIFICQDESMSVINENN